MSSRDDGFQIADISTVMLDDAKMRKLARLCPDDGELAASIVVYTATLLASWREGRRLTASEAEGWIEPTESRIGHLQTARLLDAQTKVPFASWERHFKPAWERREAARAGGRKGAAKRWGGDEEPIGEVSGGDGALMPDRPTVLPSDRPTVSPSASPSGDKKDGSKNRETDAERLARYRLIRDDTSRSADIRRAADDEVKRLEAAGYVN